MPRSRRYFFYAETTDVGTGRLAKIIVGIIAVLLIVVGIDSRSTATSSTSRCRTTPVKEARWLGQAWSKRRAGLVPPCRPGHADPQHPLRVVHRPRAAAPDAGRRRRPARRPAYLDRYGFIPGATRGGEIQLPIGFARGGDKAEDRGDISCCGRPALAQPAHGQADPQDRLHLRGLPYRAPDLSRETALLVDGGPALTDLGKFRQGLGLSILFTKYVPGASTGSP